MHSTATAHTSICNSSPLWEVETALGVSRIGWGSKCNTVIYSHLSLYFLCESGRQLPRLESREYWNLFLQMLTLRSAWATFPVTSYMYLKLPEPFYMYLKLLEPPRTSVPSSPVRAQPISEGYKGLHDVAFTLSYILNDCQGLLFMKWLCKI